MADRQLDDELVILTLDERPDLRRGANEVTREVWPQFMHHDAVANRYWQELYRCFPAFQYVLYAPRTAQVVGAGNSLPLVWENALQELPDEGFDWALATGIEGYLEGRKPTILCAMAICIARDYQGRGCSSMMVQAMRDIGRAHGLTSLIAPVRPTLKPSYPLIPIERYLRWTNKDDLPFDPWLRVHVKLGARIIKACRRSMHIRGAVTDWERWTEMKFPESGEYVVPGTLAPIEIDVERGEGSYVEPNVWMMHN